MHKNLTPDQVEYIKENYVFFSDRELANKLNVKVWIVIDFRSKLNLTKKSNQIIYDVDTTSEINALVNLCTANVNFWVRDAAHKRLFLLHQNLQIL